MNSPKALRWTCYRYSIYFIVSNWIIYRLTIYLNLYLSLFISHRRYNMRVFHLEMGSTKVLTCWQLIQCLGSPGFPNNQITLNCNIFGKLKYCSYPKLKTQRPKSNVDPQRRPAMLCISTKHISPKCMVSKWNVLILCVSSVVWDYVWRIKSWNKI